MQGGRQWQPSGHLGPPFHQVLHWAAESAVSPVAVPRPRAVPLSVPVAVQSPLVTWHDRRHGPGNGRNSFSKSSGGSLLRSRGPPGLPWRAHPTCVPPIRGDCPPRAQAALTGMASSAASQDGTGQPQMKHTPFARHPPALGRAGHPRMDLPPSPPLPLPLPLPLPVRSLSRRRF